MARIILPQFGVLALLHPFQIKKCRRVHHYVNAGDSSCSNWLRLVNCARFEHEQNLIAFQYKGEMYYRCVDRLLIISHHQLLQNGTYLPITLF